MRNNFLIASLFFFIGIMPFTTSAQTLTISNSGQTGSSGTNWSISNGQLYYTANANVQASVIVNALANGNLNLQAISNDVTVVFNQEIITTNSNALSIGNINSIGTITFNTSVDIGGPLTVYADKINMGDSPVVDAGQSAQIITRNGNHTALLAKNGFETVANANCVRGKIMTVGGGNIHITADADNNGTGVLNIDWLTIDGGAGAVLIEGASFSWETFGNCPLPEFYGTGGFTIRPTNNSIQGFNTQWIALYQNKSSITFGSSVNNFQNLLLDPCTVCLESPINGTGNTLIATNGSIETHAFVTDVNLNLQTTGIGGKIQLRSQRRLQFSAGAGSNSMRSLQTNNGDIVLWTNTINENPGGIIIGDWTTLNSANGSTNQSTGGGKIWIAGGSAVNSYGLPTGPANGGGERCGVSLGSLSPGSTTTSIYSGGGSIYINGESNATSGNGLGVTWNRTGICHSGNGVITITGEGKNTNGSHGVELGAYSGTVDIKSNGGNIYTTAITIDGITASTSNIDFAGIRLPSGNIQATGSGGIILKGLAPNKGFYSGVVGMNVLAASGNILLSAEGGTGLFYGGTLGKLAGSDVTSSSSNVTLRSNQITVNSTISVDATGQLVVEPFGTSFTNTLSWPLANFSVAGVTGLRLGKDGNIANITTTAAQTIAGPIEVYGGTITANANLTSTGTTGTGISLNGQKIIQNVGIAVTTSGANINYLASGFSTTSGVDKAIKIGDISGVRASINAGGGNVSLTGSFGTTSTAGQDDFGIWLFSTDVITSGIGSITLTGDATNTLTTSTAYGMSMGNATLKTASGAITLNGTGGKASVNSRGIVADTYSNKIISASGAITLNEIKPTGLTGTYTGFFMRPISTVHSFIGADGTEVPTSSSSVTIKGDRASFDVNGTFRNDINTSGDIVFESNANTFEAAPLLTGLTISGNPSSVRIGKTTNTANITLNDAVSAAGPISVYGGTIAVNANLTSTATTGIGISLNGQKISHAAGITSITSGSNISYLVTNSPWTAAADIGIDLNSSAGTKAIINAQGGNIEINSSFATTGTNNSGSHQEFAIVSASIDVLTSGSGTISINGDIYNNASTTGQFSWGVDLRSGTVMRTVNGDISITGRGGRTLTNIRGVVSNQTSLSIVSNSGTITLTDLIPFGNENNYTGMYFRPSSANAIKFGSDGSLVTSSSSNINFIANRVTYELGDVAVTSTGKVTIAPESNSFGSSFSTASLNLSSTVTELVIGKSSNIANITFGSTTTIAGPITAYGGTLAVNENIASSNGSAITLFANTLNFASGKTVTSNNGQLIVAPQNTASTVGMAGATGTLQLPTSYFSTNFTDGFSLIQIGTNDHSGDIASNAFNLRDNMALYTTGSVTLGGKPVLGANNLTLGSAISSITSGATNYFQTNGTGRVFRNIPNGENLILPIGRAFYNPVTIKNNTGAADNFSALVLDSVFLNGLSGPLITTPHVKTTWDISKTNLNGDSGVDFEFGWNENQEFGLMDGYRLNHFTGTNWELASGATESPIIGTLKTILHENYTGTFSPFAIGENGSALPVEMLSFAVDCSENKPKIQWQTASEHNSSYFILERSNDGVLWEEIDRVEAAGNSTSIVNYSLLDESALSRSLTYYRLIQVDIDGKSEMFGPISSNCSDLDVIDMSIVPNPNRGKFVLQFTTKEAQEIVVGIYSIEGKEMLNEVIHLTEGISTWNIDLEKLGAGVYTVNVHHNIGSFTRKMIAY